MTKPNHTNALRAKAADEPQRFAGFTPLDANFIYCPNQFFDVCLPHHSRGVVRLVAYMLRRTLGWLDADGQPIEQEISVSYKQLIAEAGISRGAIAKAIEEAVAAGFIRCVAQGRAHSKQNAARKACYALRWDRDGPYQKNPASFCGFYAGEGHRTPIPNAYFDLVVPRESLAVTKIVGTVLRHTVGYQNQFGGRRSQAPLSYSFIAGYANLADRSTLSQAIRTAEEAGYITRVEAGRFHADPEKRKSAVYAVRWLNDAACTENGPKTRPADRFKNPTKESVQNPDQGPFKNQTSDGPESRPAKRSKNPTIVKTDPNTKRQQQRKGTAAADSKAMKLLRDAGFDNATARRLSATATAEQIERQIRWLDQRKPRDNRLGMLRRAIEEQWEKPAGFDPAQMQRQSKADEQKHAELRIALSRERDEKDRLRASQLSLWEGLSAEQKAAYYRQALRQATSDFTRSRIQRQQDLDNPPAEVLALLAGERGVPATTTSPAA